MPYRITDACIACGDCTVVCPCRAIVEEDRRFGRKGGFREGKDDAAGNTSPGSPAAFFRITDACDGCGCCREVCPAGAIVWQD
ncbi:hypothetical protein MHOCP_02250 [Moorella humiferrea]|uniref:4Fe-4S binding protein n=1 Tax=Neomoorella humiferrea TaxID=676965 RepID=UPI0030CAD8E2